MAQYIDLRRIDWYARFFSAFDFASPEPIIQTITGMQVSMPDLSRAADLAKDPLSGWTYWLLYIKGYLQHAQSGVIGEGNVYYQYLTRCFGPQNHDPGMSRLLADAGKAAERVALRFRDFATFRMHSARGSSPVECIDPVVIVVDPAAEDAMIAYEVESAEPLPARSIDGYHRLFLATLFRVDRLRCEIIHAPA